MFQDVRYAIRTLLRAPGFAGISILTLALGIGATTAIFTMVHALILKPLPFRDPSRLMIASCPILRSCGSLPDRCSEMNLPIRCGIPLHSSHDYEPESVHAKQRRGSRRFRGGSHPSIPRPAWDSASVSRNFRTI